ncbi:MAG: ABC transporter permease [Anaerolineae bacterium]|jgi:putative ABC transport system permease protein|nr:ABC transporter permease [Anaerolineae bacterium]MBT4457742.1 ABC transporter permease [Anaerolineae bacterium]MBT6061181.1 ABC transporter permease [Anaerolineae bacterium]MBT6812649.1 ABC transporter permease [Anaerolineae bacterium]MBT7015973.1 ABC transporter permease [Anaerolineae bacterium]
MSSRWKKVWADFWGNKTRTFLMILTIIAGTFAVGLNSNLGLLMNRDMDADFLSANPSEATLYVSPVDDDMLASLQEIDGVGEIEGRSDVTAQLLQDDGNKVVISFDGIKDPAELSVNTLKPANPSDTTLPTLNDKEVLLDRTAKSLGYEIGDMLSIELSNGKVRELRLAGYVHSVTTIPYAMMGQAQAFVNPETLEWMGGTADYYTKLNLSVAENATDQQHVSNVTQAVSDRFEKAGGTTYFILIFNPGHHFAWDVTQGVIVVLGVLGWMTVALSAFLVVNTIVSLMSQHSKQIGIMKAIGADTRQIMVMYTTLIFFFGVVAFIVSVPLSSFLGGVVLDGMAGWLNFDTGAFTIFPKTVIQQAAVAFIIPLLAALLPMWNTVRITVREALSDYGLGNSGVKQAKKQTKDSRVLSRPVRISIRNTFRRKMRLALTLSTLVLAGAIFVAVMNLFGTFDQTMRDVEKYFLADINISFDRAYRYEKVAGIVESVPGIESVEGWMMLGGEIISADETTANELALVAPPADSTLIEPILTEGRWLTPGDENAIVIGNHLLSVRPDLKVGDTIKLNILDRESEWKIVGIYNIPGNVVPPLVYVNYDYLSHALNATGDVYSLRVITSESDEAKVAAIGTQLQTLLDEKQIQVSNIELAAEWRLAQTQQTDVLVYFMLVMAILTAVVGGLGLMSTMSINTLERTREIGVMRAIGASNFDIQKIVLVEGLFIGLLSWGAGILLSAPITSALVYGVGVAIFKSPLKFTFGVDGIMIWLAITVALAILASAIPARRASKLTVRDTLAYE